MRTRSGLGAVSCPLVCLWKARRLVDQGMSGTAAVSPSWDMPVGMRRRSGAEVQYRPPLEDGITERSPWAGQGAIIDNIFRDSNSWSSDSKAMRSVTPNRFVPAANTSCRASVRSVVVSPPLPPRIRSWSPSTSRVGRDTAQWPQRRRRRYGTSCRPADSGTPARSRCFLGSRRRRRRTHGSSSTDARPALLLGAQRRPPDVVSIWNDLSNPNDAAYQRCGRDRRRPGSGVALFESSHHDSRPQALGPEVNHEKFQVVAIRSIPPIRTTPVPRSHKHAETARMCSGTRSRLCDRRGWPPNAISTAGSRISTQVASPSASRRRCSSSVLRPCGSVGARRSHSPGIRSFRRRLCGALGPAAWSFRVVQRVVFPPGRLGAVVQDSAV